MNSRKSRRSSAESCTTRSASPSRTPRWRASSSSSVARRGMPTASATSAPSQPSRPSRFSQPAMDERLRFSNAGAFWNLPGEDAEKACNEKTTSRLRKTARMPPIGPPFLPSVYASSDLLRRVFLGDLVVEKAGRIWRRHQAAVNLGIHAGVLVDLPVGHLDFERARLLVVADRAQLGRIYTL